MVRRANRKTSNRYSRKERKIILIAAEGKNRTERNYFTEFNRRQRNYHIIFAEGNNTDPVKVVTDAFTSSEKKGLELKQEDKAYAVIDTDFGKEKQIRDARLLAKQNRVELLLSNPCFEIWILQHFRFSTRGYNTNSDVLEELKNRWPDYEKSTDSFADLMDRTEIAVENARRLKKYHIQNNSKVQIEDCNPSTNVYELVELIDLKRRKND